MKLDKRTIREINGVVKQMIQEQYEMIDEIWRRRISHKSVLNLYGQETVSEIHRRMPNLLVKNNPHLQGIDTMAQEYGFKHSDDLLELLLNYENKEIAGQRLFERLASQYYYHDIEQESEVPF